MTIDIGTERKACNKCGEVLPLEKFRRNSFRPDGRVAICRTCHAEHYYPKENAIRRTEDYRRQRREWVATSAPSDARKARHRRHAARHAQVYPEKGAAKRILRTAIERGEMARPENCQVCGRAPAPLRNGRSAIQAHHHDYTKPLDVRWLCSVCHAKEHAEEVR